ncbi:MAG: PilZ domain-containing protein [Deltaproteobacteria bacterium]|nr:PilZ domain-containing protein [Deltaproteobacteria bacterium]MBW1993144.1 PilZ domain-containing protein [Deltaproteobacteria bacterium]MBW2151044.1 PilZ domain-containing protein [Deltaproteobacteria bacterium]
MFWRKKQKDRNTEIFSFETRERRKFFRVQPSADAPITFVLDGKEVKINDIGAAGLSFKNDQFKYGDRFSTTIELPGVGPEIETDLLIVAVDTNGFCHCTFKGITKDATERIHQYVLKRQKEILQERKKKRLNQGTIIELKTDTPDDID